MNNDARHIALTGIAEKSVAVEPHSALHGAHPDHPVEGLVLALDQAHVVLHVLPGELVPRHPLVKIVKIVPQKKLTLKT